MGILIFVSGRLALEAVQSSFTGEKYAVASTAIVAKTIRIMDGKIGGRACPCCPYSGGVSLFAGCGLSSAFLLLLRLLGEGCGGGFP